MSDLESLPIGLRRLWGLVESPRRGRPAELDVEQVVRAAIRIADADGLGAVSMSRVATELGFTTMSLYRHVGGKDELLELMFDVAGAPGPDLSGGPVHWRAGLQRWAAAQRDMMFQHPWMIDVRLAGPPRGPHGIAWMESGIAALKATGLDAGEKVNIISLVTSYVRSTVELTVGIGRAVDRDGASAPIMNYGQTLAALVKPERYPEVAAVVAAGTFELSQEQPTLEPGDADFTFGLDRILDGVAVLIDQRGSTVRPNLPE